MRSSTVARRRSRRTPRLRTRSVSTRGSISLTRGNGQQPPEPKTPSTPRWASHRGPARHTRIPDCDRRALPALPVAGRADLLGWDVASRSLLHVENRTRFPNIQDAMGSYNAKRQYLPGVIADRLGLRGRLRERHQRHGRVVVERSDPRRPDPVGDLRRRVSGRRKALRHVVAGSDTRAWSPDELIHPARSASYGIRRQDVVRRGPAGHPTAISRVCRRVGIRFGVAACCEPQPGSLRPQLTQLRSIQEL